MTIKDQTAQMMKMKNKFKQLTEYIKSKGGISVLNQLPQVPGYKRPSEDEMNELGES